MCSLMMTKYNTLEYKLLCGLFLFMPFQYYICSLLLENIKIDNLFRDFVLVLILFMIVFENVRSGKSIFRIDRLTVFVLVSVFGLVTSAILTFIFIPNSEELSRLRLYLLPILIYFVTSNIKITKEQYYKINKIQIFLFAIIATYGVVQAFILGSSFLIKLGYRSTPSGLYLDGSAYYINGLYGMQRVVALYNSPNLAGALFALFICLLLTHYDTKRNFLFIVEIVSLTIGLVGTFSRSAIIGLFFALIFVFIFKFKRTVSSKTIIVLLGFLILMILLLLFVNAFSSNGAFSKMFNFLLKTTVSGDDHSLQKHITELYEPLEIVLNNPFGRGFGDNGPIAIHTDSTTAINVESSIYLMFYEEGIIFGLMFFVPYIIAIIRGLKMKKGVQFDAACICIVFMLQYLVLPTVQTYEMLFYSFAYIGFSNNLFLIEDCSTNKG